MCKCKQGGQNNTCNGGTCLNNGCRRQQRSQGVQFNINYIFRPTLKKSWRVVFLSWKQAKALFLFLFLLWMIPPTSWMLHVKHIIHFLIAFSYFSIWPWKFLRKPVILLFFVSCQLLIEDCIAIFLEISPFWQYFLLLKQR